MKTLILTLILATFGGAAARADNLTIAFDQPAQTGAPGSTLRFFGTITNNTGATLFLNSDDLNLSTAAFTTADQFFATVPISLAPGGSSGDIELFDIILSGHSLPATGIYNLFGGIDTDAQNNLGAAGFSIAELPEPSSIYLMLSSVPALFSMARKRTLPA